MFQYKFTIPLRELCKNSKRCMFVLKKQDDSDYIDILKLPEVMHDNVTSSTLSSTNKNQCLTNTPDKTENRIRFGQETTNIQTATPYEKNLVSSIKKRKASTPHPSIHSPHRKSLVLNLNANENIHADLVPSSDSKIRVLTSSLRFNVNHKETVSSSGGSKSVKFKLTKYTRKITDEKYEDNEEHFEETDNEDTNHDGDNEVDNEDEQQSYHLVLEESNLTNTSKRKNLSTVSSASSPERKKLTFIEDELDGYCENKQPGNDINNASSNSNHDVSMDYET